MQARKDIPKPIRGFALATALILFLSLWVAAIGKIFYPNDFLVELDVGVGIFEVVLACLLLLFYRRWEIWAVVGIVLATWGGYSLFWLFQELPCSCLGKLMVLPTGFSFGFDVLFFAAAVLLSYFFGISRKVLYLFFAIAVLMGIAGYFFGKWIYQNYLITQMGA